MAESPALQEQAKVNNPQQFADSPDLRTTYQAAVVDAMQNHSAMSERLLPDERVSAEFLSLLWPDLYRMLVATTVGSVEVRTDTSFPTTLSASLDGRDDRVTGRVAGPNEGTVQRR